MTWLLWLGVMLLFGLVLFGYGYCAAADEEARRQHERDETIRRSNDAEWEAISERARRRARMEEGT
jgi:hypothetical protein